MASNSPSPSELRLANLIQTRGISKVVPLRGSLTEEILDYFSSQHGPVIVKKAAMVLADQAARNLLAVPDDTRPDAYEKAVKALPELHAEALRRIDGLRRLGPAISVIDSPALARLTAGKSEIRIAPFCPNG